MAGPTVLASIGQQISGVLTGPQPEALAFDGTNYLLAWFDSDADGYTGVLGQRISSAGVVLDATPLMIAPERAQLAGSSAAPVVTYDGSNYLVTYLDYRANPGAPTVSAARVSKGLMLLDGSAATPGVLVSHTVQASALAAVFMQGEHRIAWASIDTSVPLPAHG